MKREFLLGIILVGMGLMLSGCSIINRINPGQPQAQPSSLASQVTSQPSPNDPNASLYQAASVVNQGLNDLQSTLQAVEIPTPGSSTDQSLNNTAQGLNDILQTIQAEPTP